MIAIEPIYGYHGLSDWGWGSPAAAIIKCVKWSPYYDFNDGSTVDTDVDYLCVFFFYIFQVMTSCVPQVNHEVVSLLSSLLIKEA